MAAELETELKTKLKTRNLKESFRNAGNRRSDRHPVGLELGNRLAVFYVGRVRNQFHHIAPSRLSLADRNN